MAKLEDTTPTAEELQVLGEKLGYSAEDVAVLTPEERRELMAEDEGAGDAGEGKPATRVGEEAVTEDADDLEGRGYARAETDPEMPHARQRATPTEEEQATARAAQEATAAATTEAARKAAEGKPAEVTEPTEASDNDEDAERPFVVRMPVPKARNYDAELEAVAKKFEDGEITTADHTRQVAEISRAQAHAEFVAGYNENAESQGWERQQQFFLSRHPEYNYEKNPVRFGALDAALKALGRTEPNIDNWTALKKAHAMVEKELGKAPTAEASAVLAKPAAEAKPAAAPRKPDLRAVPKTLAHVPAAAEIATEGNDRFAMIDKLDGLEQEAAIAQLSDRELDEYLRRTAA